MLVDLAGKTSVVVDGGRWANVDAVLRAFDERLARKTAEMNALAEDESPDPDSMRLQNILARRDDLAAEQKTRLSVEILAEALA